MLRPAITGIAHHLPEQVLTNEDIARAHPEWPIVKIYRKTGIRARHIARPGETASDLGVEAARKLFATGCCRPEDIDLLVLCTQSPDYALPTTACMMQQRLALPTTCAAFDFNMGCSGYIYGLSIVKGMLQAGMVKKAILVTAETYTKFLAPNDKGVRTIFGDGAAATLVEQVECPEGADPLGPFVFGTDGRGWSKLIVHGSGARPVDDQARALMPAGHPADKLYMDGPEIFAFTIRQVPVTFQALLDRAALTLEQVDMVLFHQANGYMLEHLRDRIGIPKEKFLVDIEDCGNTVSSTIPIALRNAEQAGRIRRGMKIALVGFGVGYSWGGTMLDWQGLK